jgi:hypothetical protein
MCYEDFVWFCLSEEDKCHPRAIRYWFKILDLDSDGILSGYELETFYSFTKKQLMQMTTEGIAYTDVLCQIRDMLPVDTSHKYAYCPSPLPPPHTGGAGRASFFSSSSLPSTSTSSSSSLQPAAPGGGWGQQPAQQQSRGSVSGKDPCASSSCSSVLSLAGLRLGDLLQNPHAAYVAMNMVTNVVKFLQFEQRDPFVAHHDRLVGGYERCEWDKFARVEYDRMAQEADDQ